MVTDQHAGRPGLHGGRSLASNTFSGGVARGLYGATLFVGSIVVAQLQGVDALGSFGLAVVLATFAAIIGDCGMSQYLVPLLARTDSDRWGAMLGTVRRFQLVSALPAVAAFALLAGLVFAGQDRAALLASIPWWLFTRVTLSLRSFFAVGENSIWDASASVAETAVGLTLLVLACHRFESPAWAMLALGRRRPCRAVASPPRPAPNRDRSRCTAQGRADPRARGLALQLVQRPRHGPHQDRRDPPLPVWGPRPSWGSTRRPFGSSPGSCCCPKRFRSC